MKAQGWFTCVALALSVAAACSSDDGKKVARGEAGAAGKVGAGGEAGEPSAAGSQANAAGEPSLGSSGSGAQGGVAGEPSNTAAGAAAENQGGAGGQPAVELSLRDLEGSWSGRLLGTYVCESDIEDIELTIEGANVVSNWPSSEDLGTGELVQRAGQSFSFGLFIDNPSFNQNYIGQLYVDPTAQYAIFVALAQLSDGPANSADIAILQKADAAPLDVTEEDLIGDWQGVGFELDGKLQVVEQFASSASFSSGATLQISGEDADGAFATDGVDADFASGAFIAARMPQAPENLGAMFLMSNDERAMAVALLRELDEEDGALCDLSDPFADMSIHKFALWTKAE